MKADQQARAVALIESHRVDIDEGDGGGPSLHALCTEFHIIPRTLFRGHTPSVLRELGDIFEREHRFDMAIWLNALADATED